MTSPDQLRQAMGKFATGVTVVGSLDYDGGIHGMTANALTSVSLLPPRLLVCIAQQNNTYRNVIQRGRFGISVLSAHQEAIAEYFARESHNRLGDVQIEWQLKDGGSPKIKDSLVFLECRVVTRYDQADHGIFVAEVDDIVTATGAPLLFYDSSFWAMDTES